MTDRTLGAATLRWTGPALAALLAAAWAAALPGCAPRGEEQSRAVERADALHGNTYRLRSELRPARTTLGEIVTWRLTVETPARRSHVRLSVAASDSTIEVGEMSTPSPGARLRTPTIGRERDTWRFERMVRAFDLGPRPLPAAVALIAEGTRVDSLCFPPDTLFVDSLTAGPRDEVDPDRGPLPVDLRPIDRIVAVAGTLLLALFVVAAFWLGRRRWVRAREVAAGPQPEPPAARYLRALDALRGEVGRLPRDAFYDRLSMAVRAFVEETTGVPAPERTTRELIGALAARGLAPPGTLAAIRDLLERADLAKFARIEDETAAALQALEQARSLAAALAPPSGPAPASTTTAPEG
jgi:hypothetical protein